MKVTFAKSDLEKTDARKALVSIIGDAKHGGFMRIHGFQSKTGYGEIQDSTYCKGINYGEAVKRSLAILEGIESDPDFRVTVTRGIWHDAEGAENPSGRKSKAYPNSKTVTESYDRSSPVMTEALAKVRKSLTAPEAPSKEYQQLGNGVYQDEAGTLYVRDLRLVSKTVIVHGNYPFKAGKAVTSVSDAIKRDMPVSKYRMFRMDGIFDKVTLGGIEIAPESDAPEGSTPSDKDAATVTVAPQVVTATA